MKRYIKASSFQDFLDDYSDDFIEGMSDEDIYDEYLSGPDFAVKSQLGIWIEPSIQMGVGSIDIRSTKDDKFLAEVDYETFNNKIVDIAMGSRNEQEFKNDLKAYYKKLIR